MLVSPYALSRRWLGSSLNVALLFPLKITFVFRLDVIVVALLVLALLFLSVALVFGLSIAAPVVSFGRVFSLTTAALVAAFIPPSLGLLLSLVRVGGALP